MMSLAINGILRLHNIGQLSQNSKFQPQNTVDPVLIFTGGENENPEVCCPQHHKIKSKRDCHSNGMTLLMPFSITQPVPLSKLGWGRNLSGFN